MSPRYFSSGSASVFVVWSGGSLTDAHVYGTFGARPVINLKADIQFSEGTGTSSNPYVVET